MVKNKTKIAIGLGAAATAAVAIYFATKAKAAEWISEIEWKRYAVPDVWHPISDPMPDFTDITHRFKVRNMGDVAASFRMAYYRTDYGEGWLYSSPVVIEPGQEAYIEWTLWAGEAGIYTTTWHLFRNETDVASKTVTVTVIEGD